MYNGLLTFSDTTILNHIVPDSVPEGSFYHSDISNLLNAIGSFRVRSTNFLLNLRDPPPISMKFSTLEDNA